ncbi:serine acetyltransferase [Sphingomonas piscis]|uniref:serine O-acetyltransferase n=1 Tax=Sphingomonas piscis TaxID=2714943 RepID=A0A6G7YRK4_9SPHN|nr:serine O-acetyltransferase EpsC [Sphingomonas piscis]QIK79364.1 serine acetyltransferase [Sphingomonas piscis]
MATQIDIGEFDEYGNASSGARALENSIYGTAEALRSLRDANRRAVRPESRVAFPRRDNVRIAIEHVVRALFPRRLGGLHDSIADEDAFVFRELEAGLSFLTGEIASETRYWEAQATASFEPGRAEELARFFCETLPRVRELVDSDIDAAFLGDPSVRTIEEILVSYPGAHAILYHRLAHELHKLGAPIVARMISEDAHARTGVDIHPGATVGPSFFIDHGTGVVIGETCVIGARVRLYQQVTLGARAPHGLSARRPLTHYARHPVVEDDVVIYAGATILGRVTIGARAIIGGNSWVLDDVPAGAIVSQPRATTVTGLEAERERQRLFGGN